VKRHDVGVTRALAVVVVLATACSQKGDPKPAPPSDPTHIPIEVTKDGFTPEKVSVPSGQLITFTFTRKTDETCAKEVILEVDGKKYDEQLPLDTPVELAVTFPKAATLTYACGMDMEHGTIVVN
jgi:plastocyanin domain-containing protein